MTSYLRILGVVLVSMLLCSGLLIAQTGVAQTTQMNCTTQAPATHVKLAEGDQSSPNHLLISRTASAGAAIELDICAADVTVKGGKDDQLRVSVDVDDPSVKLTPADYLQVLDVTAQGVTVKLKLPESPRAKVLVVVPATTPKLEVGLIHGNLSFETDRIGGERKINVASGHVELLANSDAYAKLHASVLLGGFHDHRPGGQTGIGMISTSLKGTGNGTIELNVLRGAVDIRAWD
jgi:hypothetical protein